MSNKGIALPSMLLASLMLTLYGCGIVQRGLQTPLALLPASALNQSVQASQVINIEHADKQLRLLAVIYVDSSEIRLNGLNALGQRLIKVKLVGRKISVDNRLHVDLPAADIISLMQLAFWPLSQLNAAYNAPWKLEESPCHRRLHLSKQKVIDVSYCSNDERAAKNLYAGSSIIIDDFRSGTRLKVDTKSVHPLKELSP